MNLDIYLKKLNNKLISNYIIAIHKIINVWYFINFRS